MVGYHTEYISRWQNARIADYSNQGGVERATRALVCVTGWRMGSPKPAWAVGQAPDCSGVPRASDATMPMLHSIDETIKAVRTLLRNWG